MTDETENAQKRWEMPTPPDGMKYLNPEFLPPERVPEGYRFLVSEEYVKECPAGRKYFHNYEWLDDDVNMFPVLGWTYIVPAATPFPAKSVAVPPDYAIPAPATATQIGGEHYRQLVIQPAEFSEKNGLSFLEGCIVKRICRHRRKDGAQDLLKARHEIDLLLQFHYPEHSTATAENAK